MHLWNPPLNNLYTTCHFHIDWDSWRLSLHIRLALLMGRVYNAQRFQITIAWSLWQYVQAFLKYSSMIHSDCYIHTIFYTTYILLQEEVGICVYVLVVKHDSSVIVWSETFLCFLFVCVLVLIVILQLLLHYCKWGCSTIYTHIYGSISIHEYTPWFLLG